MSSSELNTLLVSINKYCYQKNGNEIVKTLVTLKNRINVNSLHMSKSFDVVALCSSCISSDMTMGNVIGQYVKGITLQQSEDYENGYKQILKGFDINYYYNNNNNNN